jgi:hypothetical protein
MHPVEVRKDSLNIQGEKYKLPANSASTGGYYMPISIGQSAEKPN